MTALPVIIGRSSSHFTRVTRIFAAELEVAHELQVVADLMSHDPAAYGGNPALKLPSLRTSEGVWFGALNVCRALAQRSSRAPHIIWPEQPASPLLANAQELVLQAMSTEVALILGRLAGAGPGNAHHDKMRQSLVNSLAWLEEHAAEVLAALPGARDLSYLEVTLFCLVTHLEFRDVLPVAPYRGLRRFVADFGERPSAAATAYRFDA